MIRLSLLRHAKSSWDDPVERDFDRPLNGRGRRAATRIGRALREEGLAFDKVIASPALRVRQTIEGVEEGYGQRLHPAFDKRIYMASSLTLLELAQELGHGAQHMLLVGHNPGLEDLVLTCAEPSPLRDQAAEKYPTATLATLEWPAESWPAITEGGADLTRFIRPRDLDPSLGPDD
jgi:phosphohistidine phosphatase